MTALPTRTLTRKLQPVMIATTPVRNASPPKGARPAMQMIIGSSTGCPATASLAFMTMEFPNACRAQINAIIVLSLLELRLQAALTVNLLLLPMVVIDLASAIRDITPILPLAISAKDVIRRVRLALLLARVNVSHVVMIDKW